ncbi:SulP family inorganic anion transporter [Anatilimnocola floriformis]|uniref:SulP family inorganic anion transporter n=1 Tax=Anatilimnocola floriformis TaxID=2948575 RepID=UPI0020C48A80|nr:SulP family inorganic anion transporter [Anatilimnocola floriformis]
METPVQKSLGPASPVPFPACLRYDALSGFLVFLIALPLCLAIGRASGFPAIGGVITAIVGGIVASLISNSELTIKGPAAGLIAIIFGAVSAFGGSVGGSAPADFNAYRLALAVGVVAAVFQILFGIFKAGKLGDFFPTAAVHGLLASIGVIIMVKQFLTMLGVTAKLPPENIELLQKYPHFIMQLNPYVAAIGVISLMLMALYPLIKIRAFKAVPVQIIVLTIAVPLAMFFGITRDIPKPTEPAVAAAPAKPPAEATATTDAKPAEPKKDAAPAPAPLVNPYELSGKQYTRDPSKLLITVPLDFRKAFVLPAFFQTNDKATLAAYEYTGKTDFSFMFSKELGLTFWKWVMMFAIVASLESLLSAKAVDFIDPVKRSTDLNRDLLGCGVANLIASFIGGLPMISEIVRSRANVDAGAKSRFSNVFHGCFLLLFVSFLPFVVNYIPTSALAAMLVFTGFRLAHPREFGSMWVIGKEQFLVFVTTIVAIVLTDLLVGVLIGMALEFVINYVRGLPFSATFSPGFEEPRQEGNAWVITPQHAVTFSNWLPVRSRIDELGLKQSKNIVVDLSKTELVDHTVMEKLKDLSRTFRDKGLELKVIGLEQHRALSTHAEGARQRLVAV